MAGYSGTALYIWYTTGQAEILGKLVSSSYAPGLFKWSLGEIVFAFLVGVCLLITALYWAVALIRSLWKKF